MKKNQELNQQKIMNKLIEFQAGLEISFLDFVNIANLKKIKLGSRTKRLLMANASDKISFTHVISSVKLYKNKSLIQAKNLLYEIN